MSVNPIQSIQCVSQQDFINKNFDMSRALREGFFYLEMPEECKKLIPYGIDFANRFYQDEKIKSLHFNDLSKYHSREDAQVQVESFYLERNFWDAASPHFPKEVQELGKKMDKLALEILKISLEAAKVSEENWKAGTGGLLEGRGLHHISFNHYRPEKAGTGINAHTDFGHVTVLFINKAGLQVEIDDSWVDISPKKDHFIINFGKTLEMFVNNTRVICGAKHRVLRVNEERISFGIFLDSSMEDPVFQTEKDGRLTKIFETTKEYIDKSFKETY